MFDGQRRTMLHIAPEECFEQRLKQRIGAGYLSADLFAENVMTKMDITDIQYPDASFDMIYCSHVLEHVHDDRRALSEFHRVLAFDGWAMLLVPITAEKTIEDPAESDPAERLRRFGQEDHVRRYGPDYVDRLRDAGFIVEVVQVKDVVSEQEAELFGLTVESGQLFICSKEKRQSAIPTP